jgi:hypothetical protein
MGGALHNVTLQDGSVQRYPEMPASQQAITLPTAICVLFFDLTQKHSKICMACTVNASMSLVSNLDSELHQSTSPFTCNGSNGKEATIAEYLILLICISLTCEGQPCKLARAAMLGMQACA